jgi:hypothetical protein
MPIDTSMPTWAAWMPVPASSLCRLTAQLRSAAAAAPEHDALYRAMLRAGPAGSTAPAPGTSPS